MPAFRAQGNRLTHFINPGEIAIGGEVINSNTGTAGNTITGAMMASGIIWRTGPTAGFTDTTDTADNILAALGGSSNSNVIGGDTEVGNTFRFRYMNNSGNSGTLAAGAGVILGSLTGESYITATAKWRDFLVTVLAAQVSTIVNSITQSGSASVTFVLATGQNALAIGPAPGAVNLVPGSTVSGTGIATGTTLLAPVQGQGGVIGCTLSGTATATGTATLSFDSTVQVDSIGSGTV